MNITRFAGLLILALCGVGFALLLAVAFIKRAPYPVIALLGATEILALVVFGRIAWRLVRPVQMPAHVEPRQGIPPPMPPVGDADISGLREPVTACPDCGFLGIRMPGLADGLWPGGGETGGRMVCPRCDWQGLPVSFDTRAEYAEFLRDLAAGANERAA